jgi:hypothetical protein
MFGPPGGRVIVCISSVVAVEEFKGKTPGIRLHIAGGNEIEVYGVSIEQYWEEMKVAHAH